MTKHEILYEVANDELLLEIARKAIEERLISFRDNRLGDPTRGNGLVIKEPNGDPSSIVRFGPEYAIKVGLEAIAEYLKTTNDISHKINRVDNILLNLSAGLKPENLNDDEVGILVSKFGVNWRKELGYKEQEIKIEEIDVHTTHCCHKCVR